MGWIHGIFQSWENALPTFNILAIVILYIVHPKIAEEAASSLNTFLLYKHCFVENGAFELQREL